MGACYNVQLLYKVKDEEKARETILDLVGRTGARFHLDTFRKQGVDTDSLCGLIQVILAGYKRTPYRNMEQRGGFRLATNDFDASYSWEVILTDFFRTLAPHLEDGSKIYIEPDDDWSEYVIENGTVKQIH